MQTASASLTLVRSIAMGVLASMLFFYAIHVLGVWELENYRPDPDTTFTLLLHNKCAVFGHTHTLRPNTDVPAMDSGINGTKLGGSFMIFSEGHIIGMVVLALLLGTLIFIVRNRIKRSGNNGTKELASY